MSRDAKQFCIAFLLAAVFVGSVVAWIAHDHHEECLLSLTTKKSWTDSVYYAVAGNCKREMHR